MKLANTIKLALLIVLLAAPLRAADDGSGLQIAVAGDIAGEFYGPGATNRLDPRGIELLFYAPVDHLFEARASLAAHVDASAPVVALHEAFFGSTKLIPRSRFRIGQFFLGVGRLNQFHAHDWPFISAPKIHRSIFDGRDSINAEGALDTGIEYAWLFPFDFFLEITLGLTNGWTFGHTHDLGTLPIAPNHYLRLATYTDLPGKGGMQVGLNYLGRTDSTNNKSHIFGVDLTAKWRRAKVLKFLLQSEAWFSTETGPSGTSQKLGFYVYPQLHLGGDLFLGTRFDFFTQPTLRDAFDQYVSNYELNFVPTITYQPSHFTTLRLAYNVKPTHQTGTTSQTNHFFELQGIFILGAHPAHAF